MTRCHICVQNAADTIPIIVRRAPAIAVTLHPTAFITSVSIGAVKISIMVAKLKQYLSRKVY